MSICTIIGEWIAIVAAAVLCEHYWVLYPLTIAFIGARQHALLILMHDATHRLLFRNRWLNDWVSEFLLAWPLGVSMRAYRVNHLKHHRYLNTPADPDWVRKRDNPQPTTGWKAFASDISGLGAIQQIKLASSLAAVESTSSKALRLSVCAVILTAIIAAGGGKLLVLFWLIPWGTWLVFIMHVRSMREHPNNTTATTVPSLFERLFVAPLNAGYHEVHHAFPSVPWFRLPMVHRRLGI